MKLYEGKSNRWSLLGWVLAPLRFLFSRLSALRAWLVKRPSLQPLRPVVHWMRRIIHVLLVPVKVVYIRFAQAMQVLAVWWYMRWLRAHGRERICRGRREHRGPRKIVMLVVTALDRDPRVEREARALAAAGFSVTIVCPVWYWERPEVEIDWGPGIEFHLTPRWTSLYCFYHPFLFSFIMLRAALKHDAWAYHAHDLSAALIALVAAARKRTACVCDFHEWYAENVSYDPGSKAFQPHDPHKRALFQDLERIAIHSATEVITVCDSIARQMEEVYEAPQPIHVIRNIPPLSYADSEEPPQDLRKLLGIDAAKKIVIYQGGLGPSRNLEPVISALPMAPRAVLVLRGPGMKDHQVGYMKLAAAAGVAERVFCLPPVPSARVVAEARAADIGLWTLLANVGLNFKLALPNKIFEYLAAEIPVLAADLPEARKVVNGYRVGACFDPESPESIAAAINRLVDNEREYAACRASIPHALQELNADREWDKLVRLYRNLGLAPGDLRLRIAG